MRRFQLAIASVTLLLSMGINVAADNLPGGASKPERERPLYQVWKEKYSTHSTTGAVTPASYAKTNDATFERLYNAWQDARVKDMEDHPFSSSSRAIWGKLCDMARQGPAILPFLFGKIEDLVNSKNMDPRLCSEYDGIIWVVTWKKFPEDEWAPGTFGNTDAELKMYLKWWKEDRKNSRTKFASLYAKHKSFQLAGKTADDADSFERIRDMGIDALKFIMEQIGAGDDSLVPLVSKIMREPVGGDKPTRESVLKWWDEYKDYVTIPDTPASSSDGGRSTKEEQLR